MTMRFFSLNAISLFLLKIFLSPLFILLREGVSSLLVTTHMILIQIKYNK
jgi:hypothetical protein